MGTATFRSGAKGTCSSSAANDMKGLCFPSFFLGVFFSSWFLFLGFFLGRVHQQKGTGLRVTTGHR